MGRRTISLFVGGQPTVIALPLSGGSLTALTTSAALHKDTPANGTLLGLQPGSSVTGFPGLTFNGTGATRAISGTPTARSALITETLNGVSKNTILFAPTAAPRTMKLGFNMAPLNYYTHNDVYIDLLKSAGVLFPPATQSATGMPLTLGVQYGNYSASYLVPYDGAPGAPIAYRVITDGDMDFTGFTKSGADYVGSVATGLGAVFQITAIRTAPTHMALVRDDEAAAFKAGATIKPDFVSKTSGAACLRFMDSSATNEVDPDTTPDNYITYTNSIPRPAQIRLCRELGIPGWFNLHAKITDAEFAALFPAFDQQVADGLAPRIEYSNEVWNTQFTQHTYAIQQATNAGYTGADPAAWWMGRRSAQLAKLARGKGYRFQVGVQPAVQAQAPAFFAGQASVSGYLDSDISAWMSTGYAAGTLNIYGPDTDNVSQDVGPMMDGWVNGGDYDAGIDNILNSNIAYGTSSAQVALFLAEAKTIANAHGWALEEYESNWGHLNTYPYSRYPHGPYNAYLYAIMAVPKAKQAATQNMEVSEATGVTLKAWYNWNLDTGNSDGGRFGIRNVPAMDACTEWLAAGAAVPKVNVGGGPTPTGYRFWRWTMLADIGGQSANSSFVSCLDLTPYIGSTPISRAGWTASDTGGVYATAEFNKTIDSDAETQMFGDGTKVIVGIIDAKAAINPDNWKAMSIGAGDPNYVATAVGYLTVEASAGASGPWTMRANYTSTRIPDYMPNISTRGAISTIPLT